jgi:hypothetical protein
MFDFNLTRDAGITHLQLRGRLHSDEDVDLLTETFAFVQPDEHLIVDFSDVSHLVGKCALLVYDTLIRRAVMAETVVVSPREEISMQLVLHDVDRVSPIVQHVDDAMEILEGSWARRRQPH